jgi:hypothetical protein
MIVYTGFLRKLLVPALIISGSCLPCAAQKYCVDEIKELDLSLHTGKVNTYYSGGHEKRADELKALLERASVIFEDSLGVKIGLTMAVLNKEAWAKLMDRPYGLPTLRPGTCKRSTTKFPEAKYAAIMPAGIDGPVYDSWIILKDSVSPATMQKLKQAGIGFEQAGKVLINFVGLHELAHAFAHGFGINYYVNFFAEFIADYLTYAFLRSTPERLDKEVMAVLSGNVSGITPVHSSFYQYENFRSSEHPPTEAWYNSVITLKAAEVYEKRGFSFLYDIRKMFPEEEGKLKIY